MITGVCHCLYLSIFVVDEVDQPKAFNLEGMYAQFGSVECHLIVLLHYIG